MFAKCLPDQAQARLGGCHFQETFSFVVLEGTFSFVVLEENQHQQITNPHRSGSAEKDIRRGTQKKKKKKKKKRRRQATNPGVRDSKDV